MGNQASKPKRVSNAGDAISFLLTAPDCPTAISESLHTWIGRDDEGKYGQLAMALEIILTDPVTPRSLFDKVADWLTELENESQVLSPLAHPELIEKVLAGSL